MPIQEFSTAGSPARRIESEFSASRSVQFFVHQPEAVSLTSLVPGCSDQYDGRP